MTEEEFCSTLPIDLGIETRAHLNRLGYRCDDFNQETGQMYAKCESFSKIWNTKDCSLNHKQDKLTIREQRKDKKISAALKDSQFKPVTVDEVEYKANAQALLYRYFTTMKSQKITVTPQNIKEAIEMLQISCDLGGFPILKVKTG